MTCKVGATRVASRYLRILFWSIRFKFALLFHFQSSLLSYSISHLLGRPMRLDFARIIFLATTPRTEAHFSPRTLKVDLTIAPNEYLPPMCRWRLVPDRYLSASCLMRSMPHPFLDVQQGTAVQPHLRLFGTTARRGSVFTACA